MTGVPESVLALGELQKKCFGIRGVAKKCNHN